MSRESTQFKSGKEWRGNRNGRPKEKTFKDYWEYEEIVEVIAEVKKRYKSDPQLLKLVVEHIFGKPKQNIDLGTQDDKPIPILLKK